MADIEVIPANQLTIDQHVERIRSALDRARSAIFDLVDTIKTAHDQLGGDVFQSELAERLGMSASTLSRWLQIGNSEFLIAQQARLPSTFSSLYDLTRLEKIYVEQYGPTEAERRLVKLLEDGKVSPTSERSDIQALLKSIDDRLKKKAKKEREEKLLGLEDGLMETETKSTSIVDLISENKKFRSFVVNLPNELIHRWGDEGTSELDIMEEFPLHDLRPPSISEVVTCLLIVPMNKIDVGIKVLSSFGFTYRDTYVPHQTSPDLYRSNLQRLTNEKVVLRGERGFSGNPASNQISSSNVKDVVGWVGDHLTSPYCLVFDKTDVDGWVCLTR